MASSSFSTQSNESTSSPQVVRTPENDLLDQIAQYAQQLGQQMNQWAQGEYQKTSQVTDQTVNNFFQTSQRMSGLADNMASQYNNLFAPENAQLVRDANTYASEPRMRANMGMAGATQAQAGEQAIKNAEQRLQDYGINPADGRYAALDKAAAVQNAANIAGAMNMQRNQDIATGQKLRSEAVQVGSLLPAAVANASNTAIQANTGASNAALANANTGVNMLALADKYLGTAMGLKLPLMGQNSQSRGQGQSTSQSQDPSHPSGGGSGGGGGGGYSPGGGGSAWMPQHGNQYTGPSGGGGGVRNFNPGSAFINVPDSGQEDAQTENVPSDTSYWQPEASPYNLGNFNQNPYAGYDTWSGAGQTLDYGGGNQTYGGLPDFSSDFTGYGNISYDTAANNASPGWANTYDTPAPTNWESPSNTSTSFQDFSNGGGDFGWSEYGFAEGGPVPPEASPSGGQQVDDVRANLNANEFVIPQDIAKWKGEEFFYKLIAQSRAAREQMRAQSQVGGQPMPAGDPRAQGEPTFSTT